MEIKERCHYIWIVATSGQSQGNTSQHTSGSLRRVLAHEAEQVSNVIQIVQEVACWWEWKGN